MSLFAFSDCCALFGIDVSTLRAWLKLAHMPCHPHPIDARIQCLTAEQVQQLAVRYACLSGSETRVLSSLGEEPSVPLAAKAINGTLVEPPLLQPGADLLEKLAHLETRVANMQRHLTELVQALLKEGTLRDASYHHLIELLSQPEKTETLPFDRQTLQGERSQDGYTGRHLHPAEFRARTRQLSPLIQYAGDDLYVITDPKVPNLVLQPDSPAWFDWLATLSCFRFMGRCGRFSAYRGGSRRAPSRAWRAQRYTPARTYRQHLGVTDRLTIATLEQVAAHLQTFLE